MADPNELKTKNKYQDPGSVRQLTGFAQLKAKKSEPKTPEYRKQKKPRLRP
jgi:hypothetical protein